MELKTRIDLVVMNSVEKVMATVAPEAVQLWSLPGGKTAGGPIRFPAPINYAEFSKDGRRIAVCSRDDLVTKCYAQVFDVRTGRPAGPRLDHADGVVVARFSPNGSRVATASEDFTAMIWNPITGEQLIRPARHRHTVKWISFCDDGGWFVTASLDRTVHVWNAATGDPLTPPLWEYSGFTEAVFLQGATNVLTVGKDGLCRIWPLHVDSRPLPDIAALARLLSANRAGSLPEKGSAPSSCAEWKSLRSEYPASFEVSDNEIRGWHESVAEESEKKDDWFAAAFHLRILESENPSKRLRDRLANAEARLSHLVKNPESDVPAQK